MPKLVFLPVQIVIRFDDVNQMVLGLLLFFSGGLGCANIHVLVDLPAVGPDNFAKLRR